MTFIDAPSNFYIGRRVDPATGQAKPDDVVYYDSSDLTTHGLVLGMTGSGKTGLCFCMLEEAILDGIPAIIIDPKGDITNLLLTFPNLQASDFQTWVDKDAATREGLDPAAYAAKQAENWQKGMADWGIDTARLQKLKDAAEYSIFTPGSDAGVPISILASLRAPKNGFEGNEEALREQISGLVTAVLSLAGVSAAPTQDREHVLLSSIVEANWRSGTDVTLEDLLNQIQQPPFEKIGVLPVEKYFPEKDRFALVMKLNSVVASPSFQGWLKGQAMDMQSLLYSPTGKPRISIFYIAHLSDSERMFVVTLVLETLIAWMRNQAGTSSLRALFYMDEIFGYFPPVANPPSKEPLLRLLKQARAFGVGALLATQNPVDLDYKGLGNIGTWFIGRLQSDGDRNRILSGLKEAAAGSDMELSQVEQLISQVKSRVFLMRNIHDKGVPTLLTTRWAMNYLAGPLTRQQISVLMADKRAAVKADSAALEASASTGAASNMPTGYSDKQPAISGVEQYFLPINQPSRDAIAKWETDYKSRAENPDQVSLAYQPVLFAQASVRYSDTKSKLRIVKDYGFHVRDLTATGFVQWSEAQASPVAKRELDSKPKSGAILGTVPVALTDAKRLKSLQDDLTDTLYKDFGLKVSFSKQFNIMGDPTDTTGVFEAALKQAAREARDKDIAEITDVIEKKVESVSKKLDTKQKELESDEAKANTGNFQQIASIADAALGFLGGRRSSRSLTNVGRTFMRRGELTGEVKQTQAEIAELEKQIADLKTQLEQQLADAQKKWDDAAAVREETTIQPAKSDIQISIYGLGWVPVWAFSADGRTEFAPAFA